MQMEKFPQARLLRQELRPRMTQREMARKLGLSSTFLSDLEGGRRSWTRDNKEDYIAAIAQWKKNPTPKPRKKRTTKPKPDPMLPVPHPHGEIVGIG